MSLSRGIRLCAWAFLAFIGVAGLGGAHPASAAAGSDIVTAARLGIYQGKTRFVLELTGKVPYQVSYETGPDRITLEFPALTWHPRETSGKAKSGLVAAYHLAAKGAKASLVLDLRGPATPKDVFFIPPQEGHDWRFVVDLAPATKGDFARVASASAEKQKAKAEEKRTPEAKSETKTAAAAPTLPPASPVKAEAPKLPPAPAKAAPAPKAAAPVPPAPPAQAKASPQPAPQPQILAEARVQAPPASAHSAPPTAPAAIPAPAPPPTVAKAPPPSPPAPAKVASAAPAPQASPPAPPPAPQVPVVAPALGPHRHVVVIDPGHGGVDPGAQASDGTKEKDVVFKVADALAKKLEHTGRYMPVLTRSGDNFLKLSERVEVARQAHAELFISLHADTLPDSPDVSGTAVYTLSGKASDKEAEALAGKENRADIIAGVDLSHEPDDVTFILIDLAQRETMNRSIAFAHSVGTALGSWTPTVKNMTRQAGFRVLKAPDVPAVLVELGYLSNKDDLARITSDAWIDQFTDAVVASADHQFHEGEAKRVERVDAADRAQLR
jgi:N-acetylmuramoyl-L-alanine amidase